jgi:aryl-alcohol dehydrogenase-like predicted oxidoreductase
MHYSLLHRDLEHEFVPMPESERLALLVWSPLAGGFLSGKYTRDDPHPEGARRNTFQFPPLALPRAWAVVEALAEIAAGHQATPAQVALAWLLDKPFVTSVLVGAANPAQLAENLGAATLELDPQALARLDAITRPPVQYPGWMLPMGYDSRLREALEG